MHSQVIGFHLLLNAALSKINMYVGGWEKEEICRRNNLGDLEDNDWHEIHNSGATVHICNAKHMYSVADTKVRLHAAAGPALKKCSLDN